MSRDSLTLSGLSCVSGIRWIPSISWIAPLLALAVTGCAQFPPDAPATPAAPPCRYFVDDRSGKDARSGLSPADAWQSLERASAQELQPGDELLLRRGGSWNGSLHLRGGGDVLKPIRLGAYGEGTRPLIDGGMDSAVRLEEQGG